MKNEPFLRQCLLTKAIIETKIQFSFPQEARHLKTYHICGELSSKLRRLSKDVSS